MNFLCEFTIVIPRLPCLFGMAKAVSSTVALVISETSDCHSSSYEWYLEIVSGVRKVWVLQTGGDIDRCGHGGSMLWDGGSIICNNKKVGWGVVTLDDVAWLCW